MKGIAGLDGWRWIFIIVNFPVPPNDIMANTCLKEGLLTVVISFAAYFFIYGYPATAKFLTPREREYVIARLKGDSDAARDEKFAWGDVIKALKDPKVWLYGLCFHTVNLPIATLGIFLPTIINELGYTAAQAQLLSIPPFVAAFILTMTMAVFAERTKMRAPFIIASSTLAIIGYIVLIAGNRPEVSYGGAVMAVSGAFTAAAIIASWPANNVSGQTKRAIANAMQLSIGNIAPILGTQLYRPKWAPKYYVANCVVLGFIFVHSNRPLNTYLRPWAISWGILSS
jgi:cyanate permease